jgi:hypothetical protein
MRKLTVIVVSATGLSFAGCDVIDGGRNVAVLAPSTVVLTEKTVELKSPKAMKAVGPLSSVCFVLKNGVPFQEMGVMNRIFKDAMGGARIEVTVVLSSGSRIALSQPTLSWSLTPVVAQGDGELAACADPPCGETVPESAIIDHIETSSTPSLVVNGIYWESKKDPTALSQSSPKTDAAVRRSTKCPAGPTS